jgi:DnaJ domain
VHIFVVYLNWLHPETNCNATQLAANGCYSYFFGNSVGLLALFQKPLNQGVGMAKAGIKIKQTRGGAGGVQNTSPVKNAALIITPSFSLKQILINVPIASLVAGAVWFYDQVIAQNFWLQSWFLAGLAFTITYLVSQVFFSKLIARKLDEVSSPAQTPTTSTTTSNPGAPFQHVYTTPTSGATGTPSGSYSNNAQYIPKDFEDHLIYLRTSSGYGKEMVDLYDSALDIRAETMPEVKAINDPGLLDKLRADLNEQYDILKGSKGGLKKLILEGKYREAKAAIEDIIVTIENIKATAQFANQSKNDSSSEDEQDTEAQKTTQAEKDLKEAYAFFGLTESASVNEIKSAYRELSKKYHSDHNHGQSDEKQKEINVKYEVIKKAQNIK